MARPATRINEFPIEHLIVSFGKLFCSVCRETLAVKKNTVLKHINSSKHLVSKEKLKSKMVQHERITVSLKQYDSSERHRKRYYL